MGCHNNTSILSKYELSSLDYYLPQNPVCWDYGLQEVGMELLIEAPVIRMNGLKPRGLFNNETQRD